jgi:hypothetical protein
MEKSPHTGPYCLTDAPGEKARVALFGPAVGCQRVWGEKHGVSGGDRKIGPILGKVVWPKFAARYLTARKALDRNAMLWGKPSLPRCPVSNVSYVLIPKGASNGRGTAKVLHNPLRGGLHEFRIHIHAP